MKPEVHFLTFATADLDAARDFYKKGLGWEPILDVKGVILYFQVAPGLVLGLFDALKFDRDLNGELITAGISGVTLTCNVGGMDEVDSTLLRLADAGAHVLKPPEIGLFGGVYHAYVRDPNGIIWEVAHNPGWLIKEDGRVELGERHGRRRSLARRRRERSGPIQLPPV